MADLSRLHRVLSRAPDGPVFNPWFEQDEEHDVDATAPEGRWANLRTYLTDRAGDARLLLVGEALGYQGGHFSGLAMTSERILLGHHRSKGLDPEQLRLELPTQRTSRPAVKRKGFSEPTATIMWGTAVECDLPGEAFVLWNAFPWHPYDPEVGMLSNRKPTVEELKQGREAFREVRRLLPEAEVGAVGRVAEAQLNEVGVPHVPLRHPAHGGAPKFRAGLKEWLQRL